jgi:hypothetical protein
MTITTHERPGRLATSILFAICGTTSSLSWCGFGRLKLVRFVARAFSVFLPSSPRGLGLGFQRAFPKRSFYVIPDVLVPFILLRASCAIRNPLDSSPSASQWRRSLVVFGRHIACIRDRSGSESAGFASARGFRKWTGYNAAGRVKLPPLRSSRRAVHGRENKR